MCIRDSNHPISRVIQIHLVYSGCADSKKKAAPKSEQLSSDTIYRKSPLCDARGHLFPTRVCGNSIFLNASKPAVSSAVSVNTPMKQSPERKETPPVSPKMCIRDRLMFWGNIFVPLLTLLWSIFCIIRKKKRECFIAGLLICSVSVSYTHLDVYKRQGLGNK